MPFVELCTRTHRTRGHVKIAVSRLDHGYRAAITEPRRVRNQYDLDDESDDDGEPTTPFCMGEGVAADGGWWVNAAALQRFVGLVVLCCFSLIVVNWLTLYGP